MSLFDEEEFICACYKRKVGVLSVVMGRDKSDMR